MRRCLLPGTASVLCSWVEGGITASKVGFWSWMENLHPAGKSFKWAACCGLWSRRIGPYWKWSLLIFSIILNSPNNRQNLFPQSQNLGLSFIYTHWFVYWSNGLLIGSADNSDIVVIFLCCFINIYLLCKTIGEDICFLQSFSSLRVVPVVLFMCDVKYTLSVSVYAWAAVRLFSLSSA